MHRNTPLSIHPLLRKRYSPYAFSNEPVTEEDCERLFEAARWAPSSYNRQPWFYYYAPQNKPGFEKLAQTLVDGNAWARTVPLLILGCYIKTDEKGENPYAQYDLGQATFSLCVQAQELGYYMHQMAGFDKTKATELLLLPVNHIPHVLIAVGKVSDTDNGYSTRTRKKILSQKVE